MRAPCLASGRRFLRLLFLLAALGLHPASAWAVDTDADGVDDEADNCTAIANPTQLDADADGFGNRCDPDLNQDGIVNVQDLAALKSKFFKVDPIADLNGDGVVNVQDLALLKSRFFRPPGPKCGLCPIVPSDPCAEGKALLCPGLDVVAADAKLEECLASIDPLARPQEFQTATFLRGITRVTRPFVETASGPDPNQIDSVSEALDALGVGAAGRNPLDFGATLPLLADGNCSVPPGVREQDLRRALATDLLPRLDAALTSLPAVQSGWVDHCTLDHFGFQHDVELDGSDVLLLRAHQHGLRAFVQLLRADDLDFDLGALCQARQNGLLPTIEQFLADHPRFLARDSKPAAQAAALDVAEALDLLEDALDALHAEADPQADDLVFIDPADPEGLTPENEAALRGRIDYAQASLLAPLLAPPEMLLPRNIAERICGDPTIFLGAFFAGNGLREVLPPFVGDAANVDAVPGPTFGGIFPEQAADGLRCAYDDDGPSIVFEPAFVGDFEPASFTSGPVSIRIQILDKMVGASAGSAIDPTSVVVTMQLFGVQSGLGGGTACTATLGGAAAATSDDADVDVTGLFQVTAAPGGALVLEALLDVTGTPTTQSCDAYFVVFARDAYDNLGIEFGAVRIYQHGPVVKLSPRSYVGPSPAPVSIQITVPFGDVDLDSVRIRARSLSFLFTGCTDVRMNGQPVGQESPGPLVGIDEDVTDSMNVMNGPSADTRTWSGLVTASTSFGACVLFIEPSDPSSGFEYPSMFIEIRP